MHPRKYRGTGTPLAIRNISFFAQIFGEMAVFFMAVNACEKEVIIALRFPKSGYLYGVKRRW